MRGRVTQADAEEFCKRNPNGDSGTSSLSECVSSTLSSETAQGATGEHTASADCVAGTLSSSDWGSFRLAPGQGRDASGRQTQVFFNSDGVEVGGNADGGSSAADLFTVLCPTRAAAWKASQ
ncbi:hypothetical protein KKHFBJBL_01381 [Brevundimonas sp. NIBR11]|nr:hypothetical protein KKHFBJBL_01381 [Brevundimonas sp. NIBR11]